MNSMLCLKVVLTYNDLLMILSAIMLRLFALKSDLAEGC